MNENQNTQTATGAETKFCSECGAKIAKKAVICPQCGCQVETIDSKQSQPQIVINNSNQNQQNSGVNHGYGAKNKWVALLLCFFCGFFGAHKFYEGKIGMGILYLFTFGLFGIGEVIDFIVLLFKPNPYYV